MPLDDDRSTRTRHATGACAGRLAAALCVVAIVVATPARAAEPGQESWLEARAMMDEYRDEAARPHLVAAAEAGHARAAAALGMLALMSPAWAAGEPQGTFARRWLTRAAGAGDASASYTLAAMNAGLPHVAARGPMR